MSTIKKSQFRDLVSQKAGFTKREVKRLMDAIIDVTSEKLNAGNVVINEIGTFRKNNWLNKKTKGTTVYISYRNSKTIKKRLK